MYLTDCGTFAIKLEMLNETEVATGAKNASFCMIVRQK